MMDGSIKIDKIRLNLPFVTFIAIIGFIITITTIFITFRDDYEHRVSILEKQVDANTVAIEEQETKNIEMQIVLTEVKRDTSWMRGMLEKVYGFDSPEE